jgi:glycosyltransferase involved in cell wall biosynthesis
VSSPVPGKRAQGNSADENSAHRDRASGHRPKVLQVISHLDLGGAEEVAIALAEQLHREYEFHFFAVHGIKETPVGQAMKRRLDQIGAPVYSGTALTLKRGGLLQAAWRMKWLASRLRPDLTHLHTEVPELTYMLSRAGRHVCGNALIRTLHNTHFWGPWRRMGLAVERRLSGVQVAACSRAALEGMQQFRTEHGLPGLEAGRSRVVYNGVSPAVATRAWSAASGSLRPLRVMFAGRLEAQKGADLLPAILEQVNLLQAEVSGPVELNIYGAGSLAPELGRWAAAGVPGWTIQVCPPTPGLRDLMAEHDVLLMPSRFEGLGLVAAEALMAGLPVIGTRVAGLDEVFPAGYPLLAPSEDTGTLSAMLAEVLGRPQHYQLLAQAWAGPTTEKFGLARMARQYNEWYRELLQPAGRPQPQRAGAA